MDLTMFVCVLVLSLTSTVGEGSKRADDVALANVVEQLGNRLSALEAKNNALEASNTQLRSQVTALQNQVASFRCESGEVAFAPHGQTNHVHTVHVTFSPNFIGVPVVTSGLTLIDSANAATHDRVDVNVTNVTPSGMNLSVREWADTRLIHASVSWMACYV